MKRSSSLKQEAHFRPSDPDELVLASLVCQWCLRLPGIAHLVPAADGADLIGGCADCNAWTTTTLTPDQHLRLRLGPPRSLLLVEFTDSPADHQERT